MNRRTLLSRRETVRCEPRALERRYGWCYDVACQYDGRQRERRSPARAQRRDTQHDAYAASHNIYRYATESRSYTDVGVGSVKPAQRRRTRRVYLPDTDDRAVGIDLSPLLPRKPKYKVEGFYESKRTSSKCVGGIVEYIDTCAMSEKLSPIVKTRSGVTSPWEPTVHVAIDKVETGNNTIEKTFNTTPTQVESEDCKIKTKNSDRNKPVITVEVETQPKTSKDKNNNNATDVKTDNDNMKNVSSDSLIQHVHNLDATCADKNSRMSIDVIENKLEREYFKMFTRKNNKQIAEEKESDTKGPRKSCSTLRRRFEALRKSMTKKEEVKGYDTPKESSQRLSSLKPGSPKLKDVSIASDPPSLEAKSFSDPKVEQFVYQNEPSGSKEYRGEAKMPACEQSSSELEENGVRSMFKLWGKKFNFEDEYYRGNKRQGPDAKGKDLRFDEKMEAKRDAKKFFFFKKKTKEKEKESERKENENQFKGQRKGVLAGRCEVGDGLMIKVGGGRNASKPKPEPDEDRTENDEISRRTWLKRYIADNKTDSRRSVKMRWNNKTYTASSSTVVTLLDNVYKESSMFYGSKSESSFSGVSTHIFAKNFAKQRVNFLHDFEAWMMPFTFLNRPLPFCRNIRDDTNKLRLTISDQKWIVDKSKGFSQKIEVVLHSNDVNRSKRSQEYLKIEIPEGYFSESSETPLQSSEEEVYKIIEYENFAGNKDFSRKIEGKRLKDIKIMVKVDEMNAKHKTVGEAMKLPAVAKDMTSQGNQAQTQPPCAIGVGIITQREIKGQPVITINNEFTDDECSDPRRRRPRRTLAQNKCELAESYLRGYCEHLIPRSSELSPVSDPQMRYSQENTTTNTLEDMCPTQSCPEMFEDFEGTVLVDDEDSTSGHYHVSNSTDYRLISFFGRFMRRKEKNDDIDITKRTLPKDSIAVTKKRKDGASSKSNWFYGGPLVDRSTRSRAPDRAVKCVTFLGHDSPNAMSATCLNDESTSYKRSSGDGRSRHTLVMSSLSCETRSPLDYSGQSLVTNSTNPASAKTPPKASQSIEKCEGKTPIKIAETEILNPILKREKLSSIKSEPMPCVSRTDVTLNAPIASANVIQTKQRVSLNATKKEDENNEVLSNPVLITSQTPLSLNVKCLAERSTIQKSHPSSVKSVTIRSESILSTVPVKSLTFSVKDDVNNNDSHPESMRSESRSNFIPGSSIISPTNSPSNIKRLILNSNIPLSVNQGLLTNVMPKIERVPSLVNPDSIKTLSINQNLSQNGDTSIKSSKSSERNEIISTDNNDANDNPATAEETLTSSLDLEYAIKKSSKNSTPNSSKLLTPGSSKSKPAAQSIQSIKKEIPNCNSIKEDVTISQSVIEATPINTIVKEETSVCMNVQQEIPTNAETEEKELPIVDNELQGTQEVAQDDTVNQEEETPIVIPETETPIEVQPTEPATKTKEDISPAISVTMESHPSEMGVRGVDSVPQCEGCLRADTVTIKPKDEATPMGMACSAHFISHDKLSEIRRMYQPETLYKDFNPDNCGVESRHVERQSRDMYVNNPQEYLQCDYNDEREEHVIYSRHKAEVEKEQEVEEEEEDNNDDKEDTKPKHEIKKRSEKSGIFIKKEPLKRATTSDFNLLSPERMQGGIIRVGSKENITVTMKRTPSTIDDADFTMVDEFGTTLVERKTYKKCKDVGVLNDMYSVSNVSCTADVGCCHHKKTVSVQNQDGRKPKKKDSAPVQQSLINLIEIDLTVTQGDKTTEIHIGKDDEGDAKNSRTMVNKTNEVYRVGEEKSMKDAIEPIDIKKNDINMRIVIKNYNPKAKRRDDSEDEEFSKKISEKYNTVSTGYSDIGQGNVISLHRTTVELESSMNKLQSNQSESIAPTDDQEVNLGHSTTERSFTETERTERSEKTKSCYDDKSSISKRMSGITDAEYSTKESEKTSGLAFATDTDDIGVTSDKLLSDTSELTDLTKSQTLFEKKQLLKQLFERAGKTKSKNRARINQLRTMMKAILTSDSSEIEEVAFTNKLAADVTYKTLDTGFKDPENARFFKGCCGGKPASREPMTDDSKADNSDMDQGCYKGCLCSAVANKLKLSQGCCCGVKNRDVTFDQETNCDLRNKEDHFLLNFKSAHDVDTQLSSRFASKESISNSSLTVTSNSTAAHSRSKSSRSEVVCGLHDMNKTANQKKITANDEDVKIKVKEHKDCVQIIQAADVLQSYRLKKAVLQIYTEKSVENNSKHLIAKLPKFVPEKEDDIERLYNSVLSINSYSK